MPKRRTRGNMWTKKPKKQKITNPADNLSNVDVDNDCPQYPLPNICSASSSEDEQIQNLHIPGVKGDTRVGSEHSVANPNVNVGVGPPSRHLNIIGHNSIPEGVDQDQRLQFLRNLCSTSSSEDEEIVNVHIPRVGSERWRRDPAINIGAGPSSQIHAIVDPNSTIRSNNVLLVPSLIEYIDNTSEINEQPVVIINDNLIPVVNVIPIPIAWCGISPPSDLVQNYSGTFTNKCIHCDALFFNKERNSKRQYVDCCSLGTINVPPLNETPEMLARLMDGRDPLSKHFLENIRIYNSVQSFTSIQASLVDQNPRAGPFVYKIHGTMYHHISHATRNQNNAPPRYSQLYFYDAGEALRERMGLSPHLNKNILQNLDLLMREVNPFARSYMKMREVEQQLLARGGHHAANNVHMYFVDDPRDNRQQRVHRGRMNAPISTEVAVIFKTASGAPEGIPLFCVYPNGSGLKTLNRLHPFCDPLTYVIFFIHGEPGWKLNSGFSLLAYYAYRLSFRADNFNIILRGGKLFQQYIVDAFCCIEGNRIKYIEENQSRFRVESFRGVWDHLQNLASDLNVTVGLLKLLPSSFMGSPRNMQQNYQDAIAIIREYGKPDLFITFTCNPNWPEIKENLYPGQNASDRPDLCARVFDIKRSDLLEDITKNGILGKVVAHIHVIEFQKRGLPHMHLLIILSEEHKIHDSETVDKVVCAEIPDQQLDPQLYNIITTNMMHGPCGSLNPNSVCMVNGKCSKDYPKTFINDTILNHNGYPVYRRRDDRRYILIKGNKIDNRWVVPYNSYLSKKYNAHINVEICSSIKSVKYLFKYVYKGHDCASMVFVDDNNVLQRDEINAFLNARYVSSQEAYWRISKRTLHVRSHNIVRLAIHLPFQQSVTIIDNRVREAFDRASKTNTHLMAYFQLNQNDSFATQLLYAEIPKHYVWKNNKWQRRKRGFNTVISRIYSVSVRDIERYHLRILLNYVRGPKSFEDVRTFNNVLYSSFKEACRARKLLQDDREWQRALQEACSWQMPRGFRQLFATLCIFCLPDNPLQLWEEFKTHLSEDFLPICNNEVESFQLALIEIGRIFAQFSYNLTDFGLPSVSESLLRQPNNQDFDPIIQNDEYLRTYSLLNTEQKIFFDEVLNAVESNTFGSKLFHLNAFAGAGKSFVLNSILYRIRAQGLTAIAVAWSGIAATLLDGGTTAHSRFKIPIPLLENSVCRIKPNSLEGKYIKDAKIIIWDECTMIPHLALTAVDRLLKDIMRNNHLFGGKVVVFSGDWRQILPVSLHATKTTTIESCIKFSPFWQHFRQYTLSQNMRTDPSQVIFSNWLLKLGNGELQNPYGITTSLDKDVIEIPSENVVNGCIIRDIFGDDLATIPEEDLILRSILTTRNDNVLKINEDVLQKLPGEITTYYSADSILCDDSEENDMYPPEYFNTITPHGMPPHKLNLKKGAIIMLLRNINTKAGLCNGTRLIIRELKPDVIYAEIVIGKNKGNIVFIPRINLIPSDTDLPFKLKRIQFPIQLAFAMTINKSQGQSLSKVGLYLERPVFSHGMLYVAFSRATNSSSVRVSVENTNTQGNLLQNSEKVFTENVVYKEIFDL